MPFTASIAVLQTKHGIIPSFLEVNAPPETFANYSYLKHSHYVPKLLKKRGKMGKWGANDSVSELFLNSSTVQ